MRLLTLIGPGGVGKTRLALELMARLAPRYPDGAVFVPLAPIADHRLVAATIAQALGLRESAGRPPADLLVDYVRERRLLLCLDNLEHLLEAAPLVAEILRTSPEVKVLLTSRAPLRLAAEREFPVPALAEREAVELFVERARATQPELVLGDEDGAGSRRDLREARRASAGNRARGSAGAAALAASDPSQAGRAARSADRRPS